MFPDLGAQYVFLEELGRGGTGVVNLALDKHSGFLVAVKSLFDYHIKDEEVLNSIFDQINEYARA